MIVVRPADPAAVASLLDGKSYQAMVDSGGK
jgi:hypothetical protein